MKSFMFGFSKKLFIISMLSGALLACGGSSKGPSTQVDTGGGLPSGCTKDEDCKTLQIGPCTRGVCSPQTHECERKLVADGIACDDDDVCTDNDQCQSGACKGGAVTCQQPDDSCQSAACEPEKGCVITNKLDDSKCDDKDPCTQKDTCKAGHCQGQKITCDDSLDCTADACDKGQCTHELKAGYCEINEKCFQDGAVNPDNACEVCDVKTSAGDWLAKKDGTKAGGTAICFNGKVCDPAENCKDKDCGTDNCGGKCGTCGNHYQCEGSKCVYQAYCGDGSCDATKNENCETCPADCACGTGQVCYKKACCTRDCTGKDCGDDKCGGSCWKGKGSECNDGLDCTDDQCAAGQCAHKLQPDNCVIDKVCYPKDQHKKDDDCRVCDPAKDSTGWSSAADGTVCRADSGRCIKGQCCVPACSTKECGEDGCGGSCWNGDQTKVCDDGLACTTDSCTTKGKCSHQVQTAYCLIGNKCYKNGDTNPDNACEYCLSSKNRKAWSVRADEFSLGAGKVCFQGKPCDHAGNCIGKKCGDDKCGADCGQCKASHICNAAQTCEYQASCGNGNCDPNENCATCSADCGCKHGKVCHEKACCLPQCDNRECGDNKCGGKCGQCESGGACDETSGKCLGKVVWSYNVGAFAYSPPAIGNNNILYLGTRCAKIGSGLECADDGPAKLLALDPSKGDKPVVWSANMGADISGGVSIGKNGWLYFGDNKGIVHAYKPNGVEAWKYPLGNGIQSSVGLSQKDVYPISGNGKVMLVNALDGSPDTNPKYLNGGAYNGATVGVGGISELFGMSNGQLGWMMIIKNDYSDANSHFYTIGKKHVSKVSMASFGFLDDVAFMTSMDRGGQFCYAHYTKTPKCYAIGGVPYDSITGMVVDMVPNSGNSVYGYFMASKWTAPSADNGAYLHRVTIKDGHTPKDKVLAHVPGTTWDMPTLLADNQVLFSSDNCLYDYRVNGDTARELWKHCESGILFQYPTINSSSVPGKINNEDVVFILSYFLNTNSTIQAIRTMQPLRTAPWPYEHHDSKNTDNFTGNDGKAPW